MLVLFGQLLAVFENERSANGEKWTERTCRVLVRANVTDVRLSPRFDADALPAEGEPVALQVSVKAYNNRAGEPRHQLTAWEVVSAEVPESTRPLVAASGRA